MKYTLKPANSPRPGAPPLYRLVRCGDGVEGGLVENENNLAHEGCCWVGYYAEVSGNAIVSGSAQIRERARVFGDARVCGDADVFGDAWVTGFTRVYGNAKVTGRALIQGSAEVFGNAVVGGNADVSDCARVFGGAQVHGYARVCGRARVRGGPVIDGSALLSGDDETGPGMAFPGKYEDPRCYILKMEAELVRKNNELSRVTDELRNSAWLLEVARRYEKQLQGRITELEGWLKTARDRIHEKDSAEEVSSPTNVAQLMRAMVRKHALAVEGLTESQFVLVLKQAIESGDFTREIRSDDGSQRVVYSPAHRVSDLRDWIKVLEKQVADLHAVIASGERARA